MAAAAAFLVCASVFFAIWRIDLVAPQYPEGIGLLIRAHTIDGLKEGDLQSINGLNHYIGMREIRPESMPELRFMRPLFIGLGLLGLGAAALGRRWAFIVWLSLFGIVMLGGLADMWKWGYDYGHNLDPNAIIKVPGMSYQPPLIGSKQLLNFRAVSWPALGGWMLALAGLLSGWALALEAGWRLPWARRTSAKAPATQ